MKKLLFNLRLFLTIIACFLASAQNASALDFDKVRTDYIENQKDEKARLRLFLIHFEQALKNSQDQQWICAFYTEGLMNHISYSEMGPSFCAYVDLHQGLYRAINNIDSQFVPFPQNLQKDFARVSNLFLKKVEHLSSIDGVEKLEAALHELYKDFLIGFLRIHHNFFKRRWLNTLGRIKGDEPLVIDIIDRAFFALQKDWPGFEKREAKYQFESLYGYLLRKDQIYIVGYNNRPLTCGPILKLYYWNEAKGKPEQMIYKNQQFDLSDLPYSGGCGFGINPLYNVRKNNRTNSLRFHGFEATDFYIYEFFADNKSWQVEHWKSDRIEATNDIVP